MAVGKKVGDAYIEVHADTKPFAAEIKRLRKQLDKDFGQVNKSLAGTDAQVRKTTSSMKRLGGEAEKTGKRWTKTMILNRQRTMALNDRVVDLRKRLLEVRRVAAKAGDLELLGRIDEQIKGLTVTMREHKKGLVGLTVKDKEYGDQLTKTTRIVSTRILNAEKLGKASEESLRKVKEGLAEAEKAVKKEGDEVERAHKKHHLFRRGIIGLGKSLKALVSPLGKVGDKVSRSWQRMDSTVRVVVALILAAAPQMATLLSSLSSSLVAVAVSAAGAALALAPLVGLFAPLAYGAGLAIAGLKDLEKYSPEAASALKELKNAFMEADLPAFMKEWAPALANFFKDLAHTLRVDEIAKNIGEAFAAITDAFTAVIRGEGWAAFTDAVEGPLSDALQNLGEGVAFLFDGLLNFIAATAPVAEKLMEMFEGWAEAISLAMNAGREDGSLLTFFESLLPLLQGVLDLFGAVNDILATVFVAGMKPAQEFMDILVGFATTFSDWLKSSEGQDALQQWFENMLTVMPAVFDLIGDIGIAIADLITPEVIDATVNLLSGLSDLMPIISDILSLLSEAGILDLIVAALAGLGTVVEPLIKPLGDLLSMLSEGLIELIQDVAPLLADMGEHFGTLLDAVAPLLPVFLEFIDGVIAALAPAMGTLFDVLAELVGILTPFISQLVDALLPYMPDITAAFQTLFQELGNALTPALVELVSLLVDALIPNMKYLPGIIAGLTTALTIVIRVGGLLLSLIVGVIRGFQNVSNAIRNYAITAFERLKDAIRWAGDVTQKWRDLVKRRVDDVVGFFRTLPEKLRSFFSGLSSTIIAPFRNAFNEIAKLWNRTIGALSFKAPSWVPVWGGRGWDVPNIPTFANGGISDGPGIFGEDGREAAVPLDKPLSQVDPSVRWLAALARGQAPAGTGGPGISIAAGAIQVSTPMSDPRLVASSLLDRIVAKAT